MWNAKNTTISMTEGDFGIILPIKVDGVDLGENDAVKITFKTAKNGETILEKTYSSEISENTVPLQLSSAESALFDVGEYAYSMDWYQAGNFLCCLVPAASFKVVDKA